MCRLPSATVRFVGVSLGAALLTVGGMAARQAAPTEEEYAPLMIEIRFTVNDAEQHADSRYWPEIMEDVRRLIPMFEQVQAFWTARDNDEAAGFVTQAIAAVNELDLAASEMDLGATRTAIGNVRSACQSCHERYREETADGYRIKPGS